MIFKIATVQKICFHNLYLYITFILNEYAGILRQKENLIKLIL